MDSAPPPLPDQARPAAEVLADQHVDAAQGLSEAEAGRRLDAFGPNKMVTRARIGVLRLLLRQLESPIVYLFLAATALSAWFGDLEEAAAIAVVLVLNTLIGFITELRATRSMEALRALESRTARVRREGHERVIPADGLVPGDIVLLEAGDAVPADLRLVEAERLGVDESTLTGEAVAVAKSVTPVAETARLGDRTSMLYMGTALTAGAALGVVTATGARTELGHLSRLVAEAGSDSSPIERKLARLSTQLLWGTLLLGVAIVGVGIATGKEAFELVKTAIALAVAAIPEGLPIVATLVLARGMWRMAEQNALIERLSAVETLGATTLILTDKTGTLTENRMSARIAWLPSGEVALDDPDGLPRDDAQLDALLEVAVLCNDAALDSLDEAGAGDPMELALLRAGLLAGVQRSALLARLPEVRSQPFDTIRRRMVTVHRRDGGFFHAVKGAPEAVLAASEFVSPDGALRPMTDDDRAAWQARVAELAHHGLRVLAFASITAPEPDESADAGLAFLGLIGLEDPARSDVPQAIAACHRAGIKVVMVTGDHAITARSIGHAVGLRDGNVAEGAEAAALAAGDGDLGRVGIFARVTPGEKLGIVRAYQQAGEVVAMTGDGVNDAPALRQADIGVAMGLRGTDVAREAASMVLLDDAFPTIVSAIREGRVIFANIRRFAAYLLACNLAEVLVVGLAVLASLPLPLLPVQILYLNLITDVFPAFALALGEGEGDVLDRKPRDPKEPILGRPQWLRIALQSLLMTAGTFAALALADVWLGLGRESVVTVTFMTLAFSQLWQVFNMRAARAHPLVNEITRNPWLWAALALCTVMLALPPYLPPLAGVLGLVPPDGAMWALVLAASAAPMLLWQAVAAVMHLRRG